MSCIFDIWFQKILSFPLIRIFIDVQFHYATIICAFIYQDGIELLLVHILIFLVLCRFWINSSLLASILSSLPLTWCCIVLSRIISKDDCNWSIEFSFSKFNRPSSNMMDLEVIFDTLVLTFVLFMLGILFFRLVKCNYGIACFKNSILCFNVNLRASFEYFQVQTSFSLINFHRRCHHHLTNYILFNVDYWSYKFTWYMTFIQYSIHFVRKRAVIFIHS